MPRVKPPKPKPIAYSCLYDRGYYELCIDNVLMSKHETKTEAKKEASRLRKARQCRLRATINYKSICTWGSGSDICKYWKSCVEAKGTTFTQPWGIRQLMLLEMKREAKRSTLASSKDKELDRFLQSEPNTR